jgi:RNA polymerase sigma-70 factor (ECF subfamily)
MNPEINYFKERIVSLRQKLYLTAWKYLQQKEDAEDTVQEALLRLWQNRNMLDRVNNPAAYAMQTTVNICIDRLRMKHETVETDENNLGADLETPYSGFEQDDAIALVEKIIARLPPLQQTVIKMKDVEGYDLQEIAEITGTQVSAVTVNLSRARKKVKEAFLKVNNFRRL